MTSRTSLDELLPVDEGQLAALTETLAVRAGAADLVQVYYRIVDSPIGALLLAATPTGLVRVAFESEDFDAVLAQLAATVGPRILAADAPLQEAAGQLAEYFAGRRETFDLPLDHRLAHGFRLQVQQALPQIGYGHTASYSELATLIGRPTAVRAVGTACATNPLPLILPCHRVLRADGGLGGYLGGTAAKAHLLELEGAA